MKTLLHFLINILLVLQAQAADFPAFRFDGELKLDVVLTTKPLADAGKTEFRMPALKVNFEKDVTASTFVRARVQFGPDRNAAIGQTSIGQFHAVAEEASINGRGIFSSQDIIRYGLVLHPWIELVKPVWNFDSYSDGGAVLVERLHYSFRADLGLSYKADFSEFLQGGFWILNGEGILRDELYASKDLGLMLNYTLQKNLDSKTSIAVAYAHGKYDNYPDPTSAKSRSHLLIAHVRKAGLSLGLEGFQGQDSVDALTQLKGFGVDFANGVDLSSKGGQAAVSGGGAIYSRYRFSAESWHQYELFYKAEYIQPMSQLPLWAWMSMGGFAYYANEKMTFTLANNRYWYNEGSYGVGKRETDKWYFTLRTLF